MVYADGPLGLDESGGGDERREREHPPADPTRKSGQHDCGADEREKDGEHPVPSAPPDSRLL